MTDNYYRFGMMKLLFGLKISIVDASGRRNCRFVFSSRGKTANLNDRIERERRSKSRVKDERSVL